MPPVCSTPPFIVPHWVTPSFAVLSSAVHSSSGESNRIFTDALMVAVCMPFAVSAPVYGSYSITAPSGNDQCSASAEADGAGLSSEKMLGSTKSVLSSPPRQRTCTCSPTDGVFQERLLSAHALSQCNQLVVFFSGIDTVQPAVEIHGRHGSDADQVAQQALNFRKFDRMSSCE